MAGDREPRRGRPSGLTPELAKRICAYIRLGDVPLKYAAGACGVPYRTFLEWMQLGEAGKTPYLELSDAVFTARSQAVVRLTRLALRGGKGSSQATWLLERRFGEDYGSRQRLEVTGGNGGPVETAIVIDPISDPNTRAVLETILGREVPPIAHDESAV